MFFSGYNVPFRGWLKLLGASAVEKGENTSYFRYDTDHVGLLLELDMKTLSFFNIVLKLDAHTRIHEELESLLLFFLSGHKIAS